MLFFSAAMWSLGCILWMTDSNLSRIHVETKTKTQVNAAMKWRRISILTPNSNSPFYKAFTNTRSSARRRNWWGMSAAVPKRRLLVLLSGMSTPISTSILTTSHRNESWIKGNRLPPQLPWTNLDINMDVILF